MKKFIYFLILLIIAFTSCEQDELIDPTTDQENLVGTSLKGKLDKVTICHKGKTITVNGNALTAHLNHGDVQLVDVDGDGWVTFENECVPCGDCDDNDATIYPGAEEICDDVDNNCDGIIDEEVTTTYYADSDGDGFGDPDTTIEACSETTGYVIDNSDCDDTNSDINPDAEEICGNNIDDNCDGETDEGCIELVAIGDEYQGGIVAYILREWDTGYDSDVQHGLIASPTDIIDFITWSRGDYRDIGATGTVIGTGQANTTAIVTSLGTLATETYAARICDELVLGGYDDWFLPSKIELLQLYNNRLAIGGLANYYYWSSTEFDGFTAWELDRINGLLHNSDKSLISSVRAVRAF